VKRLTSPPMNVAEVYIPLMNSAVHIQRVKLPNEDGGVRFGRILRTVWEIEDFGKYKEIVKWDPSTDSFNTKLENSLLLKKIAQTSGMPLEAIIQELEIREAYVKYMVDNNLHEQREVTEKILNYYSDEEVKDTAQEESKDDDSKNTMEQTEQNQLQVNNNENV
jgi:flagellar protein FlaI